MPNRGTQWDLLIESSFGGRDQQPRKGEPPSFNVARKGDPPCLTVAVNELNVRKTRFRPVLLSRQDTTG